MKMLGIFIITLVCLPIYCVEFKDDAFKINATYDETIWAVAKNEKYRDRLTLRHLNLPATINILAYRFSDTITANGLVQKRIQSVYDGWQLIRQDDISDLEAKQKNVSKGIRSLYRKSYLDEGLKEQYMIAGDVCFVTDDTLGVVLNVSVDQPDTLLDIKPEFNKIYSSLWIGDNKPVIYSVVNNEKEWIMDQQNLSRKRSFSTDFNLNHKVSISHRLNLDQSLNMKHIKTYANANEEYVLIGDTIHFMSPMASGTKKIRLDMNKPELILNPDGFYAVQKYPFIQIKRYNNDFSTIFTHERRDHALNVFSINDHLLIVTPKTIQLLNQDHVVWTFNHSFNIDGVVADQDQLIIANRTDSKLTVLDLNTGTPTHAFTPNANASHTFKDIAINQSKILLVTSNGPQITQKIIDLSTFSIEDEFTHMYPEFDLLSVTNQLIIIRYKNDIGNDTLAALDFNTFATVWTLPFDQYHHTIISNRNILSIDHQNNLVTFDLSSAQKNDTLSLNQLLQPNTPTKNLTNISVLRLMPSKNKLLAIVHQKASNKIIYLR